MCLIKFVILRLRVKISLVLVFALCVRDISGEFV